MRQAGAYSKLLSGGRSGPHALPLARIKKIMKNSSEDVKMISGEAPIVFSKACELFIEELTKRAWAMTLQGRGGPCREKMSPPLLLQLIFSTFLLPLSLMLLMIALPRNLCSLSWSHEMDT
ncbi:UNVERIFIED_CONTAM: Nuclear transcription factor Y subunit C-2 [Sesamum radiatum]|uniref:Nuclear transcription factor Y subunit C-2 n=1 Tax=Sesamum radiatum TaxID=300843 RepID=A0AAW2MGJ4_SESRA